MQVANLIPLRSNVCDCYLADQNTCEVAIWPIQKQKQNEIPEHQSTGSATRYLFFCPMWGQEQNNIRIFVTVKGGDGYVVFRDSIYFPFESQGTPLLIEFSPIIPDIAEEILFTGLRTSTVVP